MESKQIVLRRRKKNMLTLEQKLTLIDRHESGETPQNLAKAFEIGEQTARDIIRQKEKIRRFVQNCESSVGPTKRKSMKVSSFEELDEAMLRWYNENRASGISVTSAMCIEQAKYLHEHLGLRGTFNASNGWLSRFKQRYGIAGVYSHSVAKTGNEVSAYTFCYQFQQLMQKEDYLPDQIYNADETGLYWKSTPRTAGTESFSSSNERVMVICCTNATGAHKLDLVVFGRMKSPWEPNPGMKPTSVNYFELKGGWASKEIFQHWFNKKWVPAVREFLASKGLPQRAILLLDTSSCHITDNVLRSDDGHMVVKFLPIDVANLVQPMQQGIVSLLKWNYRNDLQQEQQKVGAKPRQLEQAVRGLEQSWAKITPVTIRNAWSKMIADTDQYVEETEIVDMHDVAQCDMLVDREADLVEEVDDLEAIDDDVEVMQLPEGIEQVEEFDEYQSAGAPRMHVVQDVGITEQDDRFVEIFDVVSEGVVIKSENYASVGVEFTDIPNSHTANSEDGSGDESGERRLDLQTALTSVETLLGFVDQKGLALEDKKAFKKIRTDVRNLMKSIQIKKQ
uniref:HTH CENPB-type domain-containing protein n=1 Tax=Anopheles epiroticus TaxID=199890 RepID=A0A182PBD8_9DIPT